MRIACLGGGPAGLYFAIAMKRRDPGHEIVVFERNRPYDTFGWGVVLSDETLANLAAADPESAETIRARVRVLGRHRRLPSGHGDALVRATASAASAATVAADAAKPWPDERVTVLRWKTAMSSQYTNSRRIVSALTGSLAARLVSVSSDSTTPQPNVS